jgi:MOSC domain-containing protein YiiM
LPTRGICARYDRHASTERELGRDDFVYGQFGENLTVEGLSDEDVCIGDRYQIGVSRSAQPGKR